MTSHHQYTCFPCNWYLDILLYFERTSLDFCGTKETNFELIQKL